MFDGVQDDVLRNHSVEVAQNVYNLIVGKVPTKKRGQS